MPRQPTSRAVERAIDRAAVSQRRAHVVAVAGVSAAIWAAGFGFLIVTAVTLLAWASATGDGASAAEAMRTAGQAWLSAHRTGLAVPGGEVVLMPLGLTLLPAYLLWRGGTWTAARAEVRGGRSALLAAGVLAASYGLLTASATGLSTTAGVRPSPAGALIGGLLLGAVCGGAGVVRGSGRFQDWWAPVPAWAARPLVAGCAAVTALVAGGAVVAGASFLAHFDRARTVTESLDAGIGGGVVLFLIGAALVPNAAAWAAAFAMGPGFAVGAGTLVARGEVRMAEIPAFPLLAAIPDGPPSGALALAVLGVPLAAGVVAGLLAGPAPSRIVAARQGLLAGFAAGVLAATLAGLSGGAVGGGRLATVGPPPWQVGLAAAVEIGLVAAATAAVLPRGIRRATRRSEFSTGG